MLRRAPFQEEFGQAQLITAAGDHLAAASDPRSATWGAAPGVDQYVARPPERSNTAAVEKLHCSEARNVINAAASSG